MNKLMNNDSRLIQYTPLQTIGNTLIIQKKWFYLQEESFQLELKQNLLPLTLDFNQNKIYELKIEDFEIPHTFITECEGYFAFIKLYKNRFKFDNFMHLFNKSEEYALCKFHKNTILYNSNEDYRHYGEIYECNECNNFYVNPECTIIYLNDVDINELIELHIKSNKRFSYSNLDIINKNLINKINTVLELYKDDGAFIKTSLKSAKKNTKGLRITPCFTINDVMENLVSSDQILQSFLFGCNLIIRRWIDIKIENEFRVYILNKQIRAICQQSLTEKIENKIDKDIVIDMIEKFYNNMQVEYDDCVLDLIVVNNKIHLIEINSGGAWSTAGAGLFRWDEILNNDEILFRYL